MAIKRYKPEQIVTLLRQIEVGNDAARRDCRRNTACSLASAADFTPHWCG
jgi:hypothetical protein